MKALKIIAIIAAAALIMGAPYVPETSSTASGNDVSAVVGADYTGLYSLSGTAYFVLDGMIYTGTGFLAADDGTIYLVQNGVVDLEYEGIVHGTVNGVEADWYVQYGIVDTARSGFVNGYLLEGGALVHETGFYPGTVNGTDGTWYIVDGEAQTAFSGIVNDGGIYRYVIGGRWSTGTTGVITTTLEGEIGGWYISNGIYDPMYTGIAASERDWVYVEYGALSSFTGVAAGEVNGTQAAWYILGGIVQTGFNGNVEVDGVLYIITNGQATEYAQENELKDIDDAAENADSSEGGLSGRINNN